MQYRPLWVVLALASLMALAGCQKVTCAEPSARMELEISFAGFDPTDAVRLELESVVEAEGPYGSAHPYYDRRVGSMVFPSEARDGSASFLIDPGHYVANLSEGATFRYLLWVRVFGVRGGTPNLLLAEGRLDKILSTNGCYMNGALSVSAKPSCEHKVDGDPCVGSGAMPYVCKCVDPGAGCGGTSTAGLACEESTCGDGYTDRLGGELCDPAQTPATCSDHCVPHPIVLEVSDATSLPAIAHAPSIKSTRAGDTEAHGFYRIAYSQDASPVDLVGTLLAADLDGDSAEELVLALPEGALDDGAPHEGRAYIKDWPLIGGTAVGDPSQSYATVVADSGAPRPLWLGASLAAADLDGDGANDLVLGAPLRENERGSFVVVFGGTRGTLAPGLTGAEITVASSPETDPYLDVLGAQEAVGGSPGDGLGYALAAADFNGDGIADLAVGAPEKSAATLESHGAVYLIPGGQDTWQPGLRQVETLGHLCFLSHKIGGRLGVALATGDLDGDGYADLILGSEVSQTLDASDSDTHGLGAVHVIFGGPELFAETNIAIDVWQDTPTTSVDWISLWPDHASSELFGIGGAAAVGDLDQDGFGELAVTLGRRGSVKPPDTVLLIKGAAFARYRQTGSPIDLVQDTVWLTGLPDERFGALLQSKDVNGDGVNDLLIGAPSFSYTNASSENVANAGALYVVLGSPRVDYWETSTIDIAAAFSTSPTEPVGLGLIRLHGARAHGFFGTSVAVSGHIGLLDITGSRMHTYVFEPGWTDAPADPTQANKGRVWGIYVPSLLPCGSEPVCPTPVQE